MAESTSRASELAGRTGLRIVVRKFLESAAKSPAVEQLLVVVADVLRRIPGGEDIGSELINDLPPTIRSVVEPTWRRLILQTLKMESDMPQNRGRGEKPGNDRGSPTTPMSRGWQFVLEVQDPTKQKALYDALALVPEPQIQAVLYRLGELGKQSVLALAGILARKEGTDLLGLPVFADIKRETPEVAKPAVTVTSTDMQSAMKVLGWLQGDHDTLVKIQEILACPANDSREDRPAYYKWLASHEELGEDAAKAVLKAVAAIEDPMHRAAIAGVRPNYLTRILGVLKTIPGKLVPKNGGYTPDTVKTVGDLYAETRRRLGLGGAVAADAPATTSE